MNNGRWRIEKKMENEKEYQFQKIKMKGSKFDQTSCKGSYVSEFIKM